MKTKIELLRTPAGVTYGYTAKIKVGDYGWNTRDFVARKAGDIKRAHREAVSWLRHEAGAKCGTQGNPLNEREQKELIGYAEDNLKSSKSFRKGSELNEWFKGSAVGKHFGASHFGPKETYDRDRQLHREFIKRVNNNPLSRLERSRIGRAALEHEKDSRNHKSCFLKGFDGGTAAGMREAVAMSRRNPLTKELKKCWLQGRFWTEKYLSENHDKPMGADGMKIVRSAYALMQSNGQHIPSDKNSWASFVQGSMYAVNKEWLKVDRMSMEEIKHYRKNPRFDVQSGYLRAHIGGRQEELSRIHGTLDGVIKNPWKNPLIAGNVFKDENKSPSGVPSGSVLIAPQATAVEYIDKGKARAEGLKNPAMPWRHGYGRNGKVAIYGLPDKKRVLLISKKKKIWDYR